MQRDKLEAALLEVAAKDSPETNELLQLLCANDAHARKEFSRQYTHEIQVGSQASIQNGKFLVGPRTAAEEKRNDRLLLPFMNGEQPWMHVLECSQVMLITLPPPAGERADGTLSAESPDALENAVAPEARVARRHVRVAVGTMREMDIYHAPGLCTEYNAGYVPEGLTRATAPTKLLPTIMHVKNTPAGYPYVVLLRDVELPLISTKDGKTMIAYSKSGAHG
jgi:hypothetical protein